MKMRLAKCCKCFIILLFLCGVFFFSYRIFASDDNVSVQVQISGDPCLLTFKILPEKRVSTVSDSNLDSHILIEIHNAGDPNIIFKKTVDTSNSGEYLTSLELENISPGNYDIYAKGYSHLRLKKSNVEISVGNNYIDFSDNEHTLMLAGDMNVLNVSDVNKEGDNAVNSIDLALAIENLDKTTVHKDIEKEDLNQDSIVNSLDLGISIENLDKRGE